jgi:hypothetical protein
MDINNLTNVYNQNPTIQGQYTLQQYLDLFGGSSTGTTTPTTTATTPTTTNSSQGIINANINQFQNQGGGNDGYTGFGDFGNLDKSSMKEFNMPGFDNPVKGYKNTSTGLYQDLQGKNIQNLGIGSFGVMGLIEKAFGLDKKDPKYAGLFDKVNYYFNGGIAGFKNGGRINFRGGGMDMGNASNQAQSASMGSSKSSTNQGPAGGASSGGNYGGNRNPKQTYGGGGGRPKTNIITKSGKDLAALFNVPVQGIQALFGNPFNRKGGFLTKAGLTPGQIENLEKDANEIGGLKGKITNTTYGSPNNMFGFHKNMDLTDFANSATFGQGNFTKDPTTGKISLDGGNYDFKQDQFGKVGNFINDGGVSGFVNRNVVEPISKFGANLYEDQVNNSNINYLASGGRVGAKDGGSMTQIVKDRLMDKNPAMWGLGYEGLASLQDLIMSIPFNQGGIVNIRRR